MMMNKLPKTENASVEFKTAFNENVIETLVAFSNAKGGTVYVGVSDKRKITGVTVGKETVQSWINEIKNKTSPKLIPDAEEMVLEKKTIVALSVPEYPVKPVSTRGKYFKRSGNSNHLLGVDEIANEHLKTINSSWDMYPNPVRTMRDISFDKVRQSMEALRNNGMTVRESPEDFLDKYDLVRDGKPTNAAYLMFKNKNSVETTIELGRFQNPITIKDTARTKSDICTQVDEVLGFVKKHINLEVIITGNARNTQKWQYPMEALREIVLNMIIHRDYRSASDSIVKIFNDKIEFYNPGRLPDTISVEDLLANSYKSTPRNKKIAEFFKDMGLIEKYGSGIQRIIGYCKDENCPLPVFENISDGFLVTVYAIAVLENTEKVTDKINGIENDIEKVIEITDDIENDIEKETETTDDIENDIEKDIETTNDIENGIENTNDIENDRVNFLLKSIQANPYISSAKHAKNMNVSWITIMRDIAKLKSKGLIERIGPDKGGYWKVKND